MKYRGNQSKKIFWGILIVALLLFFLALIYYYLFFRKKEDEIIGVNDISSISDDMQPSQGLSSDVSGGASGGGTFGGDPASGGGSSAGIGGTKELSNGVVENQFTLNLPDGVEIKFVKLSKGNFIAGGYPIWNEHKVSINEDFSISIFEITQAQFKSFFPNKVTVFQAKNNLPIESVSWVEAMEFANKLTEYFHSTGQLEPNEIIALPTEYQWEYAAKCDMPKSLESRAWFFANSGFKIYNVGAKEPNIWGIYDMNGNVSEWCRDSYLRSGISAFKQQNVSDFKVIKGGSYADGFIFASERCGSSKNVYSHQVGFRIVIEKKD